MVSRGIYNENAEKALLGLIIRRADAFDAVDGLISPSDFFFERNRAVYTAMAHIMERYGSSIDPITLDAQLRKDGTFEAAGGERYISELCGMYDATSSPESYAGIIRDLSLRRNSAELLSRGIQGCTDLSKDALKAVDETIDGMMRLSLPDRSGEAVHDLGETINGVIEEIYHTLESGSDDKSIPTGFEMLDRMANGGFYPGQYVIIAARPSIGKTAFAVSMIQKMIRNSEKPQNIAFFSLEMGEKEIGKRIIAAVSKVKLSHLIQPKMLSPDETDRIISAADNICMKHLTIIDTPNIRLSELRAQARMLKREKGITAIFIDYIGLIDAEAGKNTPRHEQIGYISRSLKALARELQIPVIALCQVTRDSEEKTPMLSNLRDSGSIEQDADIVMFLHRKRMLSDEEKKRGMKDERGRYFQVTKVIIAKQRNGMTGEFKAGYDALSASFENIDQGYSFISP